MRAQCSALHAAELEFYPKRRIGRGRKDYSGRITQVQAKILIREVRRLYDLPRISLKLKNFPTSKDCAWVKSWFEADHEISSSIITFSGVNPLCIHTLLHELTHIITDYIYRHDKTQTHGPEFVGIMSWLFDYFRVIPADALGVILRRHGVRRLPSRSCTPDVLRRRRLYRLKS